MPRCNYLYLCGPDPDEFGFAAGDVSVWHSLSCTQCWLDPVVF